MQNWTKKAWVVSFQKIRNVVQALFVSIWAGYFDVKNGFRKSEMAAIKVLTDKIDSSKKGITWTMLSSIQDNHAKPSIESQAPLSFCAYGSLSIVSCLCCLSKSLRSLYTFLLYTKLDWVQSILKNQLNWIESNLNRNPIILRQTYNLDTLDSKHFR